MQADLPQGVEDDKDGEQEATPDLQETLQAIGLALTSYDTSDT